MRYCLIIPTYNNDKTLEKVISEAGRITNDIIVVNDGSTDNTLQILKRYDFLKIVTYQQNKGKGFAIRKGFELAFLEGFTHAITIDSDGQHDPSDIKAFLNLIEKEPDILIAGDRNLSERNISKGSRFANRFSNFWFKFLTGISLKDTQTGFRSYPLERLKGMKFFTRKYEFETEILVRAAWKGIEVRSVPVNVYYPPEKERVSHYRFFSDFLRISLLNTILVLVALLYVKPFSFVKYLTKRNIREFVNKYILLTEESDLKVSTAIAFGVFMGIVPIWGFQLITAIALAHFFRLSKFVVAVAANISLPPAIPFILYLSYITGGVVLGTGSKLKFNSDLTVKSFENNLFQYIIGAIVFAVIMGILAEIISLIILKLVRKNRLVTN
jgi:glycosyltransferase involved in cell wall biosynthesis